VVTSLFDSALGPSGALGKTVTDMASLYSSAGVIPWSVTTLSDAFSRTINDEAPPNNLVDLDVLSDLQTRLSMPEGPTPAMRPISTLEKLMLVTLAMAVLVLVGEITIGEAIAVLGATFTFIDLLDRAQ
jgi:hypothetical protein